MADVYWIGSTGIGIDLASGAFVVEIETDAGPVLVDWEDDTQPEYCRPPVTS